MFLGQNLTSEEENLYFKSIPKGSLSSNLFPPSPMRYSLRLFLFLLKSLLAYLVKVNNIIINVRFTAGSPSVVCYIFGGTIAIHTSLPVYDFTLGRTFQYLVNKAFAISQAVEGNSSALFWNLSPRSSQLSWGRKIKTLIFQQDGKSNIMKVNLPNSCFSYLLLIYALELLY